GISTDQGGGAGDDVIDGGEGFDTIALVGDRDGRIDLSVAIQDFSNYGLDTLISIEGVIGSDGRDSLAGNAAENYLAGKGGSDFLYAVGGGDVLDGGEGDDFLRASKVGSGDYMSGGAGADTFFTMWGAVTLDGGDGADLFYVLRAPGMIGTTVVNGGAGTDTLDLSSGYIPIGGAMVDLSIIGPQDIGAGQVLDISGVENLVGGPGNDLLKGDVGANLIEGREGADTLIGGQGRDQLIGGTGIDTFVFAVGDSTTIDVTGSGVDVISDFQAGDELRFSDAPAGFSYVEGSAGSFASALATVNSMLTYPSTFHEYIAFQVDADVYVFSGHPDAGGAGLENV
ncbi:MAG: hypothetical protein B7Y78_14570, partial [Caulobacter sp. 35-67-4]